MNIPDIDERLDRFYASLSEALAPEAGDAAWMDGAPADLLQLAAEADDIMHAIAEEGGADAQALALLREVQNLIKRIPRNGPIPRATIDGLKARVSSAHSSVRLTASGGLRMEHNVEAEEAHAAEEAREEAQTKAIQRAETREALRVEQQAQQRAATARREVEEGGAIGFIRNVAGARVAAVVAVTSHKARTAAGATGLAVSGLLTGNADAGHEGVRVIAFGVRNNIQFLGEENAQNVAHGVRVVGDTAIAARVGGETLWEGAGDVLTGQGGHDHALTMGRGTSRTLQRIGVSEDTAENVGHRATQVFTAGADASVQARRNLEAAAEQARQAAALANRRRDDAADAIGDRFAARDRFGQNIAGLREFIDNDPGLKRIFDKDRDGKAETHEIREVLEQRYRVRNMNQADANDDGRLGLSDLKRITERPSQPRH